MDSHAGTLRKELSNNPRKGSASGAANQCSNRWMIIAPRDGDQLPKKPAKLRRGEAVDAITSARMRPTPKFRIGVDVIDSGRVTSL
jgi:hypothetical protein